MSLLPNVEEQTQRAQKPRMGVLSLPLTGLMKEEIRKRVEEGSLAAKLGKKLLAGSSVPHAMLEWLREGGIKPVLLDFFRKREIVEELEQLDGLLLTGGGVLMFDAKTQQPTPYLLLVRDLITRAKEINASRSFPVWGICLGFEAMLIVENGLAQCLREVNNKNRESFPLSLVETSSPMFELFDAPTLAGAHYNYNHRYGIHVEDWKLFPGVMLTSQLEFGGANWAASFQYRDFPFFGLQFHPEVFHFERGEETRAAQHLQNRFVNTKWAHIVAKSFPNQGNVSALSDDQKFNDNNTVLDNIVIYPKLIILHK